MVIYGAPSAEGRQRLGLSVSKKTGNAVARNLIRRRLSEAYAREQVILPESYDTVIVARAPISLINFHNMEIEMGRLMSDLMTREAGGTR